jgi:hypothetical protein
METVKTNYTGIDLGDANLPKAGLFGDEDADSKDEAAPAPEPEPVMEIPSPEMIKQRVIAAEDPVLRRQTIMTIQKYYNSPRFGKYLVDSELVTELKSLTTAEMQALLGEIKFAIQNKNAGEMIQRSVPQLIVAAEPLVSALYDVKGLGNALIKSDSFKDLLEEVALENQVFSNAPASTRLMYEILKTGFFVHEHNAYLEAQKTAVTEQVVKVSSSTAELMK